MGPTDSNSTPGGEPFGRGWKILMIAILVVIMAAIVFMVWGLVTH